MSAAFPADRDLSRKHTQIAWKRYKLLGSARNVADRGVNEKEFADGEAASTLRPSLPDACFGIGAKVIVEGLSSLAG